MEIAEMPGQPDPLYPTLELLVKMSCMIAPKRAHEGLKKRAEALQATYQSGDFYAEARMMRVIQDGIDFGRWPS